MAQRDGERLELGPRIRTIHHYSRGLRIDPAEENA